MKKTVLFTIAVFIASTFAIGTAAAMSHEKEEAAAGGEMAEAQTTGLQTLDQLAGFQVLDQAGEKVGAIEEVIVDLDRGQIGYVVVQSGGMMKMGGKEYIVPWSALKSSAEGKTLTLTVSSAQLRAAPEGDILQALTRKRATEIHQFYGVAPYWEKEAAEMEMHPEKPEKGY